MRSANGVLKALGMCCAMTMPGASAGMPASTSLMASVPPVEAPMAISRSVVRKFSGADFCSTASADSALEICEPGSASARPS